MPTEKMEGHPRRSTGMARPVGAGYLENGQPDLSPTAGYAHTYPVQYSDENDTEFAGRVAQWESSYATAQQIAAGGATLDQKKEALRVRYEADLLALEAANPEPEAKPKAKKPK